MAYWRTNLKIGSLVTVLDEFDRKRSIGILLKKGFKKNGYEVLIRDQAGNPVKISLSRADLMSRNSPSIRASDEKNPELAWLYQNAATQSPEVVPTLSKKRQAVFCQKCLVSVVPDETGKCEYCRSDLGFQPIEPRFSPKEERFGPVQVQPKNKIRKMYEVEIVCDECPKRWRSLIEASSESSARKWGQDKIDEGNHYDDHPLRIEIREQITASKEKPDWKKVNYR